MKELKPKKVCKICNDELPSNKQKLCDRKECFNIYYDKKELGPDDIVTCLVCNKVMGSKLFTHLKVHQLNKKSYIDLYPGAICESPNYLKSLSEKMKGEKNIAFNHGGKNSPFSTKYIKYEHLSEEERDQASKEISKKAQKTTRDNDNYTTSISYYQKQGMTEDEAKEALSERQTTFTIAKCIEKYGEEGRKVWQKRQDKWLASLDSKSDEEKMRINRLKTSSGGCISMAERELKKFFDDNNLLVATQYSIDANMGYTYDFCVGKKIIEYNGTYWHCDPRVYTEDYFHYKIGKTSKEVWERDKKKQQYALDHGYQLLIIWENEYKKNKQETLQQCLNFLMT